MNDYVTDPSVLAQLNGGNTSEYVTDPALLAQLNAPESLYEPGKVSPYMVPPTSMPTIPGAGQAYQTAKTIVSPTIGAAGDLLKQYANPAKLLTDVTLGGTVGVPPTAVKTMAPGVQQSYQNVMDWLSKSGQFTPPPAPPAATGINALDEIAQAENIASRQTPAQAMKAWQTGGQVVEVAGGKPAQEGATFIERMAAKFAPMAERVAPVVAKAAPVLNTAARVAGPVGLAMNAYEVNKMARETDLGGRMARGEVQNTMNQAQQRMLNAPTAAPLTKQEAINLLSSGDQRTINIYGGEQRLRAIAGQ